MVPNREGVAGTYKIKTAGSHQPSRLSMERVQKTISDISLGLSKESAAAVDTKLPAAISEVEDAKCECCGMGEECTPGYIKRVKERYSGKLICGLCAEAVKEEMEKNGGKREQALSDHMNACSKFNSFGRAYPVLLQAEAMREMFKKNKGKSNSLKDKTSQKAAASIARSASCIPAIAKEIKNNRELVRCTTNTH